MLCFLLPPVAVLSIGKPFSALVSIPFTLLCWVPGVIHAILCVNKYYADQRVKGMSVNVNVVNQNTLAPEYHER